MGNETETVDTEERFSFEPNDQPFFEKLTREGRAEREILAAALPLASLANLAAPETAELALELYGIVKRRRRAWAEPK